MTPDRTRVLFIVGKGRSGTTFLGNLVGQAEGFVSVGELWRLWQDDPSTTLCGCGSRLTDCVLWSEVIGRLGMTDAMRRFMLESQERVMSWGAAPSMLWHRLRSLRFRRALDSYGGVMGSVYEALADAGGADVVVDSSKWPLDPGLLGHVPGIESFGVHVVRDPRAVAHSWRRRKAYPGESGFEMPRFSPLYSAVSWSARNLVAEAAGRRLGVGWRRLRYEDLVSEPAAALAEIMGLVDAIPGAAPTVAAGRVAMEPSHTVAGNPDRMASGSIEIRPDDAWRTGSGRAANWLVTAVCFPLMVRYGYPLRVR